MKNLLFLFFAIFIFLSCEKEPCQFGTVKIENIGNVPAMIYSIESHPTLLPGETINQQVKICTGFDANGNECGDGLQTIVSYKFGDGEMKTVALMVYRCQTEKVRIFN